LLSALFGEKRAVLTVILWASFFLALLTMYLLLNWLPSLLVSRGLSRPEASIVQVAFNVVGALGSALTGLMMDRTHRSLVVLGAFGATALALVFLAGIPATLSMSILAGALIGGTVSGTQAIMYALAPMLYPKAIRGTGVGVAVAIGRAGSAVGPLLGAALVGAGRTPSQVLLALLPIIALAGLGALAIVWIQKAQARSQT
jgi:AAHS family 3-hydroxyphenylpropionic acid transporter